MNLITKQTLMAFALALLLCACGGNATAPTTPTQIPTFIGFASSASVGYNEIRAASGGSISAAKSVAPGGTYSELISGSADLMDEINAFSDIVLTVWSSVEVPTDPNRTTYERAATPTLSAIKMSFVPYDLDGDGSDENCSGTTCPVDCAVSSCDTDGDGVRTCPTSVTASELVPVCIRIWVDSNEDLTYERYMGMLMNRIPDPQLDSDGNAVRDNDGNVVYDNIGEGRYRAPVILEYSTTPAGAHPNTVDTEIGVVYDQYDSADPESKSTEIFLIGDRTLDSNSALLSTINIHALVDQQTATFGAESKVQKTLEDYYTVTPTSDGTAEGYEDDYLLNIERFLGENSSDTDNYLAGTIESIIGYAMGPDECVDLDTGDTALLGDPYADYWCPLLSVEDQTISAATTSDVAFPNTTEFPEIPPF